MVMQARPARIQLFCLFKDFKTMAPKNERKGKASMWLYFGVGILILLLLVWLTIADFWGDTDVNAIVSLLG